MSLVKEGGRTNLFKLSTPHDYRVLPFLHFPSRQRRRPSSRRRNSPFSPRSCSPFVDVVPPCNSPSTSCHRSGKLDFRLSSVTVDLSHPLPTPSCHRESFEIAFECTAISNAKRRYSSQSAATCLYYYMRVCCVCLCTLRFISVKTLKENQNLERLLLGDH